MRLEGSGLRLVIVPESQDDKERLNQMLENKPLVYWGDAEGPGSGMVINGAEAVAVNLPRGRRHGS